VLIAQVEAIRLAAGFEATGEHAALAAKITAIKTRYSKG
jgi:hypothetical protein